MADKMFDLIKEFDSHELGELSDAKILDIKKRMEELKKKENPFFLKNIVPSDGQLLALFVPMYRDYLTKLMVTGIIGFANRMCDEWEVPESVPVVPVYEYIQDQTLLDSPKPVGDNKEIDPELEEDYANNRKSMKKRLIVKEFLEYLFQYDPDEHVRGAYVPNPNNKSRKPVMTPAARLSVWMEKKRLDADTKTSNKEKKKADSLVNFIEKNANDASYKKEEESKKTYTKTVTQRIGSRKGGYKIVKRKIRCTEKEYKIYEESKKEKILKREKKNLTTHMDDFIKEPKMVKFKRMNDETLHDTVRDMLPPQDIFHRFTYYFESNYEELQNAVNDIYHERPEIDYAIHPLEMVSDLDEARKFKRKHDINWDINVFQKGRWSLVGPYKQNRDKLDCQGSGMPLFDEMFGQNAERNKEIGAQLMKKRKTKKRLKQEKRKGKIHESVKSHANVVTDVSKYVSEIEEPIVSDTEEDESVKARVIRIGKGGLNVDIAEFDTEYDANQKIQWGNSIYTVKEQ